MPGTVHLVGAGPGDAGLMTARSLELIARADAILHDRLIPAGALDAARPDAELIYVGKQGGGAAVPQSETIARMVELARAGCTVVRLKGGDPFVFGRGGEEALALAQAGVPFEVVPGVTAGIAGPAYAGIPVTHRDRSSAVALITGHEDPEKPDSALDWAALAVFPGTLVFYMGLATLPRIAERLIAHGRPAEQPAAVIERATLPGQRTVSAPLGEIAACAREAGIGGPALTVIGAVTELREELRWLERRPLFQRSVAVTRAGAQASGLAARLRELGATVIEAPAIRIVPLAGEAPDLARYDLLCLTSANGVRLLFERLAQAGRDARALAGTRVAAIGPGTAHALREHGVIADVVPQRALAESLVEALVELPVERALIARAREGRDVLGEALRARGAEVDELALYETVVEQLAEAVREAARGADYVTFASASAARSFFTALGGEGRSLSGPRLVSIGPITTAALREHGLEPHVEAARHDVDGLVEALLEDSRA